MRKFIFAITLLVVAACSDPRIESPTYLEVPAMELQTNYASQGTRSSRITTAWVYRETELLGAFELPIRIPIIGRGNAKITLVPGVTINGVSSTRAISPFFTSYEFTAPLSGVGTISPPVVNNTPVVSYNAQADFSLIDDFDGVGLNFTEGNATDTLLYRTNDPAEMFPAPPGDPANVYSGKVIMPKRASLFEIVTTNAYGQWPGAGIPVYLEMNYKTEIPLVVGVFVTTPGQIFQVPVVQINPRSEWNKIYIDLAPELGYPDALSFKVFIGGVKGETSDFQYVYLDNIKVVY